MKGYCQPCCHCLVTKSCPTLLRPHGLYPTRLLCSLDFPGKNIAISSSTELPDLGNEPLSPALQQILYHWATREAQQQQQQNNYVDVFFFFRFLECSQNFLACSICIVYCPEHFKMMSCHSWFLSFLLSDQVPLPQSTLSWEHIILLTSI